MDWKHNALPFIPSLAFTEDWSDFTIDELIELSSGGKHALQISLTDNSMYDRYYRDDIVNLHLGGDLPEAADGLIVLPDASVIFRSYTIADGQVTLTPYYADFGEPQSYPEADVQIIGVANGIMRVS
jgi:hypothetical protein